MRYSPLGNSTLQVSRIGLGTMMFGWRADAASADEIIRTAIDHGINFIDTSVSYSRGACHEIIGDVFQNQGCRKKFVLATKVGGISNDNDPPHFHGYSRANIIRQCELSLKQLKTDFIDLLQLHQPSEEVAIEESLGAIKELIARGLVRYAGVCNYSAARMIDAFKVSQTIDLPALISNQISYSLIDRGCEKEILPAAKSTNSGIITWGPLSSGLLSDWYVHSDALKPSGRLDSGRERDQKLNLLGSDHVRQLLNRLGSCAKSRHMSVQQLAVSWVLSNESVSSVLIGPSTTTQFTELLNVEKEGIAADVSHALLGS